LALVSFKSVQPKAIVGRSKICKVCNRRPFLELFENL
jgi:hypothetical protein